jgi:hypothetical protein
MDAESLYYALLEWLRDQLPQDIRISDSADESLADACRLLLSESE